MKTTKWYPANIKPVREGWYETLHPEYGISYTYWSGYPLSMWTRYGFICNKKFQDRVKWRGLTEKAK